MSVFELREGLGILFLGLEEVLIPLLIEFLVLLDVGLLAFLTLLRLIEDKLLIAAIEILLLQFGDSVLGHFGLDILAFALTRLSVILKNFYEVLDVIWVWLGIQSLFLSTLLLHFF